MNFLTHALPYLDEPVIAICTGIPDWLSVVDRKIRVRERMAREFVDDDDPFTRAVAHGILRHIQDDRWFHATRAFSETNLQLAVQLRELLPGDQGFRPMFLGHIVIEMLLDAFWIRDQPDLADRYYRIIENTSAEQLQSSVNRISKKPSDRIAETIRRFADIKFLYDYSEHERLHFRLNQVMKRVRLEPLPESIVPWIATASELVESRRESLLTHPDGTCPFPLPPEPRNHDR